MICTLEMLPHIESYYRRIHEKKMSRIRHPVYQVLAQAHALRANRYVYDWFVHRIAEWVVYRRPDFREAADNFLSDINHLGPDVVVVSEEELKLRRSRRCD